MNRGRSSTQIVLCFLAMLLLAVIGCSGGSDSLPQTYSISGAVTGDTLGGVTINLTDAANASTTDVSAANASTITDAEGKFSFTGRANGTYTVTPVKAGYTFNPISTVVVVSGASVTGRDFLATATGASTYIISGTVSGAASSGVTITLSGDSTGSVVTGVGGTYSISGLLPGSYTVTPSRTGFTFSPTSSAVTITTENSAANDFFATIPTTFTQADLTGTWRMNLLKTGNRGDGTPVNEWDRARITINSSGVATCLSVDGSFDGGNVCPSPFNLTLTMNPSTGVITQSGDHAVNDGGHMTMTSNKNFLAGTGTGGTGAIGQSSYQLVIVQKEVAGTVYSNADMQGKSFVYHQLQVGTTAKWEYGTGTTDGSGAINLSSSTDPSGTTAPGDVGSAISIDGNGVATMTGASMATFQGFLSDDKKTVVGTVTQSDGGNLSYRLMIIQITGQIYTAGFLPPGASVQHVLGCGATAFWIHYTSTVGNLGVITFSNWVASDPSITAPASRTGSLDASGKVTLAEDPSYHGQVSHDGKFTVNTLTGGTNPNFVYMLGISTK